MIDAKHIENVENVENALEVEIELVRQSTIIQNRLSSKWFRHQRFI